MRHDTPRPARRHPLGAGTALAVLAILVSAASSGCGGGAARALPPEEIIVANSRGAAALGQQETERAVEEFRKAVEKSPDDPLLLSNLGLAEMLKGEFESAEKRLRRALEIDPDHVPSQFRLGVILKNRGAVDEAIAWFEKVAAADPDDLVTHYHLGSLRARKGDDEAAIAEYRKALELDPTHISTLYGMGRVMIQKGNTEEGSAFLARSQQIREETGLGETVGLQYGEQGKYSLASEYPAKDLSAPPPIGVRFEIVDEAVPAGEGRTGHLGFLPVVFPADGDGHPDLVLASPSAVRVFTGAGDGRFRPGPASGTGEGHDAGVPPRRCAARPGDLDDDGTIDLVVSGPRVGVRVWRGAGGGRFEDVTTRSGLPSGLDNAAVLVADVDHDGDLDVVLGDSPGSPGVVSFHVNDGSGVFKPREGAKVEGEASRADLLASSDFDNDRDLDVLVASKAQAAVLSNLRDGTYRRIEGPLAGTKAGAIAGLAMADLDKDGFMDAVLARTGAAGPVAALRNRSGRGMEEIPGLARAAAPGAGGLMGLAVAPLDYDNDGFVDVALLAGRADADAWTVRLYRNGGAGVWTDVTDASGLADASIPVSTPAHARLSAADLDGDGDVDLVAGTTVLRNTGGDANTWIEIVPRGVGDNRNGAGTKVEIRAGALWQKFEAGADGLPVHMGLGRRERVDGVRLLWPGGVLQDEIDMAAKSRQTIEQLDRKGTSCPVLYAWDGRQIRFVTDFLGGCAIGYRLGASAWNTPDTDEYVKIPAERIAGRDGVWDLRMVNQLEEVIFFDRAELVLVDHPAGVEIYPDERLMPSPPFPDFRIFRARDARPPVSARDGRGRDVLDRLRAEDRLTVDGFTLLPFKGYAEEHELVLDLGDTDGAGQVLLLLDGWIDYADSTSNLAASQAGLSLLPPRLDARKPGGGWRVAVPSTGFPAGLPKTMTVDLTGRLREGEREVRLVTSMRIYWDRIRVATSGEGEPVRVTRLDASAATLSFLGYPREFSPDGRAPKIYDYTRIAPVAPWKAHPGAYTRYGDVRELLAAVDDRYVTTKHGDEVALSFDMAAAPPLPEGWARDVLLYADGFGKDMDPNSARPGAVGPLPFHAMTSYPYDGPGPVASGDGGTLDRYNTRIVPEDPLGAPGAYDPVRPDPGGEAAGP